MLVKIKPCARFPAWLRAIEATVSVDGVVTLAEPVTGPCKAVLTLLVEDRIPNSVTLAAMDEPIDDLPHYRSAEEAKAALGI